MRLKYLIPIALFAAGPASGTPIDGTFNYQGRLTSGGAPITGNADVRFSLWDAAGGGSQIGGFIGFLGSPVTDGLFNADLNFGVDALNGEERWLQIEVRSPAGVGSYVDLGRQEVLGAPYAIQTRGIFVDSLLGVHIGTHGPGNFLFAEDGDSTVANIGSSGSDGGGFIFMSPADPTIGTIVLDADTDDFLDADAQGSITLRSYGGGPGGLLSIEDDDGNETVGLTGGGSGGGGTLTLRNSLTNYETVALYGKQFLDGGAIVTWSEDGYIQTSATPDISGEGVFVSFRRTNSESGFTFDGNYMGTGNPLVRIDGASRSMLFNTNNSGDLSVVLPTDAIRDTEIIDEPGVASALEGLNQVQLTGAVDTILSRTITCPASGYCVVIGTCQGQVSHSTGTTSYANFGVSDTASSLPVNQDVLLEYASGAASGTYTAPVTVHGTFSVSAGVNTFYLLGNKLGGTWTTFDSQLTVMYFPTAYGTVTSTLLARNAGGDASAPIVAPMSASEVKAEQLEGVAFDQNRRAAEAADYQAQIADLRAQLQQVLREQDVMRQDLQRVAPHAPDDPTDSRAVLGHGETSSQ